MDKLTIEQIAPYLPYGLLMLDMKDIDTGIFNKSYNKQENTYRLTTANIGFSLTRSFRFPILRPLSDLTKEIEHKGHTIIPIDYISTSTKDGQRTMRRVANEQEMDVLDYWKVQRLFEMHFDVFGLIDAGLAIDINTSKGDPNNA